MLNKIREWSFPVGLIVAWTFTAGYTVSALSKLPFGSLGKPLAAQTRSL